MKLKNITFTFENCEMITIDGKYIGSFLVDEIKTSIQRVACNAIIQMDIAKVIAIEIHKDANKYTNTFGRKLMAFDRFLEYDDITSIEFELVEHSLLKIRDNLSDFSLNTMKVEDFPNIDFNETGTEVTLKGSDLRDIIDQTCFAASDKETRPILTGVNFKANGKVLECVATDSYRLAKKVINLDENAAFNVTIPAKTLNEIGKILETEANITLSISSKKIIFNLKNTKISTRLISGVYPDTSKIIPTSFLYSLDSTSHSIVNAIDRASLLSPEKSNFVKMSLSEDSFVISSKSLEIGSVVERIKNFIYSGDRLDISFTARYVIDAIRAIGSEEITILLNGDMKTFIIKNKNDDSNIQLVQPVRTY